MPTVKLRTRALRLEERTRLDESHRTPSGEVEQKTSSMGWYLTIETDGPPVSFYMGHKEPELPLTLEIEVTK